MPAQINNLFLCGLSPESCESLVSQSETVELPLHTVLYDSGGAPRHAYFLTSGLASVVTPMLNGEVAEVGFIANEGVVGSLQLLGSASISTQCMMQLAGSGLKIQFAALRRAFESSEEIRKRVLEFVQEQAVLVAQIAGCNRLHSAEQRLVRWLLMAQDRTRWDTLKFTQEYLSEMIGTQRTTVTILAGDLQRRGLIRYCRGSIRIVDREGLEGLACDCYPVIKSLYYNLYNQVARPISSFASSSSSNGTIARACGSIANRSDAEYRAH